MPYTPPTQRQVIQRVLSDFRSEAGINPLPNSIERGLCVALAGQSKGQYTFQSFIFKQCFPTSAEEHYFWRWAAIWDIVQKPGVQWQGVIRVTGTDGEVIPDASPLTRSDGAEYITDTDGDSDPITGGFVDVPVTAVLAGVAYNLDDGDPLVFASTIPNVDSNVEVTDTTQTGTDDEEPEDGLVRLLQRLRTPPSGGVSGDYVRWALEVAGVTRAWERSPAPGQVAVSFVRDDDGSGAAIIPDSTEREEVQEYVQSKAPITVVVTVDTLTALNVGVTISDLTPDTAEVRAAIELELTDFFQREAEPGGVLRISRLREAISIAAGESSHTLVSPLVDIEPTITEIPIFTGLTVS